MRISRDRHSYRICCLYNICRAGGEFTGMGLKAKTRNNYMYKKLLWLLMHDISLRLVKIEKLESMVDVEQQAFLF